MLKKIKLLKEKFMYLKRNCNRNINTYEITYEIFRNLR